MKKVLSIIALIAVLVLSVACFASCGNDGGEDEGGDKVTVSWYQGSKLLKEESITKGSKVTTWTPAVEARPSTVGIQRHPAPSLLILTRLSTKTLISLQNSSLTNTLRILTTTTSSVPAQAI